MAATAQTPVGTPAYSVELDHEKRLSRMVVTLAFSEPEVWKTKWLAGIAYTQNQVRQSWQWQRHIFEKQAAAKPPKEPCATKEPSGLHPSK